MLPKAPESSILPPSMWLAGTETSCILARGRSFAVRRTARPLAQEACAIAHADMRAAPLHCSSAAPWWHRGRPARAWARLAGPSAGGQGADAQADHVVKVLKLRLLERPGPLRPVHGLGLVHPGGRTAQPVTCVAGFRHKPASARHWPRRTTRCSMRPRTPPRSAPAHAARTVPPPLRPGAEQGGQPSIEPRRTRV